MGPEAAFWHGIRAVSGAVLSPTKAAISFVFNNMAALDALKKLSFI
jgi:hypothetical protein